MKRKSNIHWYIDLLWGKTNSKYLVNNINYKNYQLIKYELITGKVMRVIIIKNPWIFLESEGL